MTVYEVSVPLVRATITDRRDGSAGFGERTIYPVIESSSGRSQARITESWVGVARRFCGAPGAAGGSALATVMASSPLQSPAVPS